MTTKPVAIQPSGMPSTAGAAFSHGVLVGPRVIVAGQVSRSANLSDQADEAMRNVIAVVEAAGGSARDIVLLRFYTTEDGATDLLVDLRRRYFEEPFPAATQLRVAGLARPELLIEIEAEAIISGRP